MEKKQPMGKRRIGRINAAIWPNRTEDGRVWYSVDITRRYSDGDEWKNSTRFSRDDLPAVAFLANWACSKILEFEQDAVSEPESESDE